MQDRTEDGRTFRMPCVIDEFTRRCLAILVARRLRSDDVLQRLTDLFVEHGPPEHIRSANGLARVGGLSLTDWHRDWGHTTFTFGALAKAEIRPLPFFAKGAWSKSDAAH